MKHALHESVQLSWYSYLIISDRMNKMKKTSGNVSFDLNLDLNLETSVKIPARARIKCRGRIYILLKVILNIKNTANVVLYTAIKTKVLVLFPFCCLIGKSLKRAEVSCLFYVIWLKTIHTLNYYYNYSIYKKMQSALKIMICSVFLFQTCVMAFAAVSIQKHPFRYTYQQP